MKIQKKLIATLMNSPDQFLFSAFGTTPPESTEDHPLNKAERQKYVSAASSLRPTSPDILSHILVASAKVTASGMIT